MTASNLEGIFNDVYRETMIALERSHPGERVTIFLSTRLYLRLEDVHLQLIECALNPDTQRPRITLFGCTVEIYDDNEFSFYVTTAKKIKYENI